MAVYQGARRRAPLPFGLEAIAVPARRLGSSSNRASESESSRRASSRPRAQGARRAKVAREAATRTRPPAVGIALAAIVIVFSAAFLSLSQSVRVAATGYDIVRLVSDHDRLEAIRVDLQSDVVRLRSEAAIRKQALDAGLGQLGGPVIIPAR